MIEAIVGWWPSKGHPSEASAVSGAVAVAAFAVFGMPVLIAGCITVSTHFLYRRISYMSLSQHIAGRDRYILRRVYFKVLDVIEINTLDNENEKRKKRHEIEDAINSEGKLAADAWTLLQSERLRRQLAQIELELGRTQRG